jgi:hypothetical protein
MMAETYVGLIEHKYENKKVHLLVKKLKKKKQGNEYIYCYYSYCY